MAFGFPAKHTEFIPLNNSSTKSFILQAIKVFRKLNWLIINANENEIVGISHNKNDRWNETISIKFDENTVEITSSSNGNQIYDSGRNKKNTSAFLELYFEELNETSNTEITDAGFEEQMEIEKSLFFKDQNQTRHITAFYSFLSILIPSKGYFITPVLIYLNFLIFIIMSFKGVNFLKPTIQDIIDWGGNYGALVYENDWSRLLTSSFIQKGILNLILNCISLGYAGLILESYLKKWQFLAICILSGVITSLCSLHWNKDLVTSGLSGISFTLYGIIVIALLFKRLEIRTNLKMIISIIIIIAFNLFYNFTMRDTIVLEISGFILGLFFGFTLFLPEKRRNYGMAFITSSTAILAVFMFIKFKNSNVYIYQIMEYEERMQEFTDMEKMAMEAYAIYYGESKDEALYMIQERGIYYWEENINLIKELDKLYLPKEIHEHNDKLIEYCKLRIDVYELGFKKIAEETTSYDSKINSLNIKIERLMGEIRKKVNTN